MAAADLLRFVTIYFIFVMGFSQGATSSDFFCFYHFSPLLSFLAYYIIFQSYTKDTHPMPGPAESIISVFIMSLGSFGSVWGDLDYSDHPIIGKVPPPPVNLAQTLFYALSLLPPDAQLPIFGGGLPSARQSPDRYDG
jgi:hypothetical protein